MVVDAVGNVIVAGSSNEGVSGDDWAIVKYSHAGVPLWTNRFTINEDSNDSVVAIGLDGDGNVFVAGTVLYPFNSFYVTVKYSSAGVPAWTRYYASPISRDAATALAVDGSGNVFVTGYSVGPEGGLDYATIKYSGAGLPLWTNRYQGARYYSSKASAITVDGTGNVFVTGRSAVNFSVAEYATIKYSNAGVPLWTNRYPGPVTGSDEANAIAVDNGGNVLVTGYSSGSGSSFDYATIKYSSAGAPIWTNRYNGPANGFDRADAVVVDGNDNVIVSGISFGASNSHDYVTIAYSSAGAPLWTNRLNRPGMGTNSAPSLTVDASGNAFVTGSEPTGASSGYVTIKYSSAGALLWTNRHKELENGVDAAAAVAVDGGGNVFVTGASYGNGTSFDFSTIAYSGAGMPLWTNRYHRAWRGGDSAGAMSVDSSGNVIVTGSSIGKGSYTDYMTIAYSNAGVPLWTNGYNGPASGYEFARAIAVDANGNVFVTGYSYGISSSEDYATVGYSSAGIPLWTNRYNGPTGKSDDEASAIAVDTNGRVFVTGTSDSDYLTIAYSNDGMPLWTNRFSGVGTTDRATAVVVNSSDEVFVTGYSQGTQGTASFTDIFTIKYSSAGLPLWTNRYNGPGNSFDRALAAGADNNGNVFVAGASDSDFLTLKYSTEGAILWTNRFRGSMDYGSDATALAIDEDGTVFVTGDSDSIDAFDDFVTIAYSNSGLPLWTNRYNGPNNGIDKARAIAVDRIGNVFVTGNSSGIGSLEDYATIAYSNAGVPLWTNRYNGLGNREDYPSGIAVDARGNVFVAGSSRGANGDTDYAVLKYEALALFQPKLIIQKAAPKAVRICWATNAANYVLESKDSSTLSGFWMPVNTPLGIEGSNYCITNATTGDNGRLYRLRSGN